MYINYQLLFRNFVWNWYWGGKGSLWFISYTSTSASNNDSIICGIDFYIWHMAFHFEPRILKQNKNGGNWNLQNILGQSVVALLQGIDDNGRHRMRRVTRGGQVSKKKWETIAWKTNFSIFIAKNPTILGVIILPRRWYLTLPKKHEG